MRSREFALRYIALILILNILGLFEFFGSAVKMGNYNMNTEWLEQIFLPYITMRGHMRIKI